MSLGGREEKGGKGRKEGREGGKRKKERKKEREKERMNERKLVHKEPTKSQHQWCKYKIILCFVMVRSFFISTDSLS